MNFQLNIYGSPLASNASKDALAFAQQCLEHGHTIKRCFFYFDGVYVGLSTQSPAGDEANLLESWRLLSEKQIPLFLCIAAATNRGVLDKAEADRYGQPIVSAHDCFELTGLGQWATGFNDADKIISFK